MSVKVNQTDQSYNKLWPVLMFKVKTTPGQILGKILTYIALIVYSLFSLLPLYWIVTWHLRPRQKFIPGRLNYLVLKRRWIIGVRCFPAMHRSSAWISCSD